MNTATKAPSIILTTCNSSQIYAHGHCPTTNTLRLQFKGKSGQEHVYDYGPFTEDDYMKFTSAESLGSHFGAHIKNAKHDNGAVKFPFTKHAIVNLTGHGYHKPA